MLDNMPIQFKEGLCLSYDTGCHGDDACLSPNQHYFQHSSIHNDISYPPYMIYLKHPLS